MRNAVSKPMQVLNLVRNLTDCSASGIHLSECLGDLAELLHFDASMLTAWTPSKNIAVPLSTSYSEEVSSYLASTYLRTCPGFELAKAEELPLSMRDTPFSFYDTMTFNECLGPAGFREGVTHVLRGNRDQPTGILYLSSSHSKPLSDDDKMLLLMLTPTLSKITHRLSDEATVTHIVNPSSGALELVNGAGTSDCGILTCEDLRQIASRLLVSSDSSVRFYHKAANHNWWKIGFHRKESRTGPYVVVEQRRERPPMMLTFRELEIANLTCFGLTNPEIAEQIGISLSTVKTHLEKLYEKLCISRRAEVPMKVFQHDLFVRKYRINVGTNDLGSFY